VQPKPLTEKEKREKEVADLKEEIKKATEEKGKIESY
jgi:hypothetical protein